MGRRWGYRVREGAPGGHDCRGHLFDLGIAQRAAVEQQPAVANDADHRRVALTERGCELLLDGAGEARQLSQRQRAAADSGDGFLDLAPHCSGQTLRACAHEAGVLADHAQYRNLAGGTLGVEVDHQRAFQRSEGQLVRPERHAAGGGAAVVRPGRPAPRRSRPAGRRAACPPRSKRDRLPRPGCPPPTAHPRSGPARPSRDRRRVGVRVFRATLARSETVGSSVKPTARKFDWCTRKRRAVSGPTARS